MTLLSVWTKPQRVSVGQKCLQNAQGDYVGIDTGKLYAQETHYHSPQCQAVIVSADTTNRTGMYHLDTMGFDADPKQAREENRASWKRSFVGCLVTVEEAHQCGVDKVYRCVELGEYFSESEIALLPTDEPRGETGEAVKVEPLLPSQSDLPLDERTIAMTLNARGAGLVAELAHNARPIHLQLASSPPYVADTIDTLLDESNKVLRGDK